MTRLRRHQLAYLTTRGWAEVLGAHTQLALRTWAERRLPLVVTRQCGGPGRITLGWPAPLSCGRLRLSLQLDAKGVAWYDEFPAARAAVPLLPQDSRCAVRALLKALERLGSSPRVYGSYGWQLLTGLDYVHPASDLDLWLSVGSERDADAAVGLLQASQSLGARIDGELMFPGGAAVAWREYAAWRAGRTRGLLVKRLDSVDVEHALALPPWCEAVAA
ncbi:malonate decarboxylase holo-[acyl-carrier-protein] synthase [Ramlibacter sp. Leaf400]|uniref:malonate decarboxylase holo-[acyl-carrier-protein] synthase n=1 Tax=Ramlibacter sp. Leaf400 TaxID=1736365 RepID=UPI0006FE41B4|nr:malonate decarboxylase holo-[acyl-carrier-protein] synthase [Ramlibacter sp. Leaf400]KQT11322.1 hypothetical protein ASG30_05455 [Ramlibacter sp. Leaf400]